MSFWYTLIMSFTQMRSGGIMCLGNGIYDLGSHKGSKSSFREMLEIRLTSYSFFSPTVTTP